MYLRDVLKNIVANILQRHAAAAADEIACALADEVEGLAQDRLADLRTRIKIEAETRSEP